MNDAARPPIRITKERGGQLLRIVLDRPKGNVLDIAMVAALRDELRAQSEKESPLKLIVFEGAGAHFSFGASVPEHLPDRMRELIPSFHAFFRELEALSVPTAALVRGQCLGGGLELAAFCGMLFCDETARLGQPETVLGVFPPIGALVLPWRVGGARGVQLVVSGDTLDAPSAHRIGLVDDVSKDPEGALQGWFQKHLAPKSAVAVRYAWRAARRPLARVVATELPHLESLYLDQLMAHSDPVEGITAFLERRSPVFTNR